MPEVRLDPQQRFTCASCARCCHAVVVISPREQQALEKAKAARWFRETGADTEGAIVAPFEPLSGRGRDGWFQLRRRADGACGFLSPRNRCRLHEELGAEHKPLACRLFPFSVLETEAGALMPATFSCPSIADNTGEPVVAQARALSSLRSQWRREQGGEPRRLELVRRQPLSSEGLAAVREGLLHLLDAPGPEDGAGLIQNLRRIAVWIEDLGRMRVVRLKPDAFADYAAVTGRHAAAADRVPPGRRPSRLARLYARGFLFVVAAAEAQRRRPHLSGLELGFRAHLLRLLLHAHGVGPATDELDAGALRRITVDRTGVAPLARHYLRASFEMLGGGRRPLLDEIAFVGATLRAGFAFAAAEARHAGASSLGTAALRHGLNLAADAGHVEGLPARILDTLTGGAEAFDLVAREMRR